MKKGCERIAQAIHNKERIALVGDYDVDGVVASALMHTFFSSLDISLDIYLPNRFCDGYGLGLSLLERINADVIITVDNGIASHEAAHVCQERNIDLIITDHHTPKTTLPLALAIINPKRHDCSFPYKELCGAAVAWYFCAGLKKILQLDYDLKTLLDFVTIATIADSVPLKSMNRLLCKVGMHYLNLLPRPCWMALRQTKPTLTFDDIAFNLAPKINSAGRLDDASLALQFLLAPSLENALHHLNHLETLNNERKLIEKTIFDEAKNLVDNSPPSPIILVYAPHWHEGVVGIVASRLVDTYGLPSIVLAGHDTIVKGSARSPEHIDILSILVSHASLLTRFGGHKAAAGLSIHSENIPLLHEAFTTYTLQPYDTSHRITGYLPLQECDLEIVSMLESFEPYGEANPRPLFRTHTLLTENRLIGVNAQTLKLRFLNDSSLYEGVKFRTSELLQTPQEVRIDFIPTRNSYYKTDSMQLMVEHLSQTSV